MKKVSLSFILFSAMLIILISGCTKHCCNDITQKTCFTPSSTSIIVGQVDTFNNCGTDASAFLWQFGDGTSSILGSPTHAFTDTGIFNVKLVALSNSGKYDSVTHAVNVTLPAISSSNYTGSYNASQSCTQTGLASYSISVTTNGPLGLNIFNLYNTGKTFTATINGLNGNIPPQIYNNGTRNQVIQGSFSLSATHDSLFTTLAITAVSWRDDCNVLYIK